jgi:hypothetical protein
MPKRRELVAQIKELARHHNATAKPVRQGRHEIWECDGLTFPIPRHREIAEGTAQAIMKRLADHLEDRGGEGR